MPTRLLTIRGRMLAPDPDAPTLRLLDDAVLELDASGRITAVREPVEADAPETWPGAVILPGFVDTHLHYPQTRVIGSASGPLLPWLERSVFPEEARFADRSYAAEVAEEFCDALIQQGTTCAAIYSSSHPTAAQALLEALDRRGLRAETGLTLMDRNAPPELTLDRATAMQASAELLERWHGHDRDRLRLSMIPRFAISCTPELLRAAGEFARTHALTLQTHISENRDEIRETLALFPDAHDYLEVYESHGCTTPRTILAHCIHLSEQEWQRVAGHDLAVAHCPDSNFFLGSGCMGLADALARGVRVGLGTDVGAGRTFSMRRTAAAAYDASLICGAPVAPEQLLWLATRGGARALGKLELGCLASGYEADLVAIRAPRGLAHAALIDALLFRHDAGPVLATVVRGVTLS
ncbi:MAG TPA: guanine deaminase [Enhygromyxa sp.]|nr:guanine deaminase [Enhygromyxa sp.]